MDITYIPFLRFSRVFARLEFINAIFYVSLCYPSSEFIQQTCTPIRYPIHYNKKRCPFTWYTQFF